MADIDTIISNAMTTANNATSEAESAASALISSRAGVYITPPASALGFSVDAVEPDVPEIADAKHIYEVERDKIIALLSDELADFFTTYYPLESDASDDATAWIIDVITNGGTGINATIEDQIWQRAREKVLADGRRVEAQITAGYLAKGHFLPQGSMTKKIEEARLAGHGAIGEQATGIATKQAEIEIETVKFAVDKAIQARSLAMAAAADYIRAIASAPGDASRIADLTSGMKARLMSATADMYRARMSRDELILKSKMTELATEFDIYRHRRDSSINSDQVNVQALIAAADVFGKTASAALSSLNTVASQAVSSFE